MRSFTRGRGLPNKRGGNIKPLEDVHEWQQAISMETPPLIMECFDISNTYSVASMVRFKDGRPDNRNYRRYWIKTVKGQIENDKKTRYVRLPNLVIVDGGKGQLSSAFEELRRLGLQELPIVGLAKEREEIFSPGNPLPLTLPHETGALKMMQRIRDEAHRFANGYHQILMKRRISESILDDCPGISESRKAALLKKFGSVARLRKATTEQLAELHGISHKLAAEIVDFLQTHKP
jgi:excinuclease ABC subunit C